jgi:large subunit ribosomal protein L9
MVAEQADSEILAAKLQDMSLEFTVKAGEGDKLFGSITSSDIADKLAQRGYAIDKRSIELDDPIKMIGIYKVPIRLHAEVHAEVRVWVVKEE